MIDYAQIQRTARYVARRLPHWASVDADDLAQESAIAALRGRQSRKGPMQDALRRQGWLKDCRAGKRVALDARRHKTTPEGQWSAAVDVHRLLDRLTAKQREAVELHYLAGMRESEISRSLTIPIQRVKNRIHEGLKNMRGMIR